MEELKRLDEVAYVRFASVYRQFTDVSSFMDELNKLVLEGEARAKEDKPSGEWNAPIPRQRQRVQVIGHMPGRRQ